MTKKFKFFIATILILFTILYMTYSMPLPFVSSIWNVDNNTLNNKFSLRHRIADGFILTERLIGVQKKDVQKLLGIPPETGYFKKWDLVYYLGQERGFLGIDSEWLVLKIDENNKVVETRIVSD